MILVKISNISVEIKYFGQILVNLGKNIQHFSQIFKHFGYKYWTFSQNIEDSKVLIKNLKILLKISKIMVQTSKIFVKISQRDICDPDDFGKDIKDLGDIKKKCSQPTRYYDQTFRDYDQKVLRF